MKTKLVIKHFGNNARVAAYLTDNGYKITRQGVDLWSEYVPLKQALRLQRLTGGKLKADMRHYEG